MQKLKIKTANINSHLGTIQLTYNSYKFEFTRFRQESYSKLGGHSPDNVSFVDDINLDCLRRDFTINSIYYDIEEGVLVDKTGGQKDLENELIQGVGRDEGRRHKCYSLIICQQVAVSLRNLPPCLQFYKTF